MRRRSYLFLAVIAGMAACARAQRDPSAREATTTAATTAASGDSEVDDDAPAIATTVTNGTPPSTPKAGGDGDGDAGAVKHEGVPLYAFAVQAPILSGPEWPPKEASKATEDRHGVVRLGYLRRSEQTCAKPQTIAKANCTEGWYELVGPGQRGFICGKFVTLNASHKELKHAPHPP